MFNIIQECKLLPPFIVILVHSSTISCNRKNITARKRNTLKERQVDLGYTKNSCQVHARYSASKLPENRRVWARIPVSVNNLCIRNR